jgi:hypothetical protein
MYMGMEPVIAAGLVQRFGLGCTFVPVINLPRTDGISGEVHDFGAELLATGLWRSLQ